MEKLAIVPARENLPRFEEYLRCLCDADPGSSGEWKEAVTASALELFLNICNADRGEGMLTVSADLSPEGVGLQFVHAGGLYNPVRDDRSPCTHARMNEISYEYKYGRNVTAILKRKSVEEGKEETGK